MLRIMSIAATSTETTVLLTGTDLGPFNTIFPCEGLGDVAVWLDVGLGPVRLGGGFSIAGGSPLASGANVTLDASLIPQGSGGDWPAGCSLTLTRETADDQPSVFGEGTQFSPAASEGALDHVARQVQEALSMLRRALLFSFSALTSMVTPTADTVFTFDSLKGFRLAPRSEFPPGAKGDPGGDLMAFGALGDIHGLRFPAGVHRIRSTGYLANTRIGAADYVEIAGPVAETAWTKYDADGRYWTLAHDQLILTTMFGAQCDTVQQGDGSWSGTDDHGAWLAVVAFWTAFPGVRVHHPAASKISTFVRLPSYFNLTGDGDVSKIVNVDASGDLRRQTPLWLGNWYIGAVGTRVHGGGAWTRLIDQYACTATCNAGDHSVVVSTANAAHFTEGMICYLRSTASTFENPDANDYELPLRNALHRVQDVDLGTGVVTFDRPVGFDDAAPILCRITPGATDAVGPIEFVQGGRMDGISFVGATACGSHSTGAYDCHLSNIGGHVRDIAKVNGFAYCSFQFRGEFDGVAAEVKFCGDYASLDIEGNCRTAADTSFTFGVGLVGIGEYCRGSDVKVKLTAPSWRGPGLIQLQPGRGCKVDATIYAPSVGAGYAALPIDLFGDTSVALEDIDLVADIVHGAGGSNATVVASAGTDPAKNCRIKVKARYVGGGPPTNCVVVHAGKGLIIEGGDYDFGVPYFEAGGSLFRNNITGYEADGTTPVVFIDGPAKSDTAADRNYFRGSDGVTDPWGDQYTYVVAGVALGAHLDDTCTAEFAAAGFNAAAGDMVLASYTGDTKGTLFVARCTTDTQIKWRIINPKGNGDQTAGPTGDVILRVIK